MATPRPVHYAASGSHALAFACYFRDLRAHLDAPKRLVMAKVPKVSRQDRVADLVDRWGVPTVPRPRRHTDLSRVTCRQCWVEIRHLARKRLEGLLT